jgi:hypothetical protein
MLSFCTEENGGGKCSPTDLKNDGKVKVKPLVIGRGKSPKCLKAVKYLPSEYEHNSNTSNDHTSSEQLPGIFKEELGEYRIHFSTSQHYVSRTNSRSRNYKYSKIFYTSDMGQSIIQSIDDGLETSSKITKRLSALDKLCASMKA